MLKFNNNFYMEEILIKKIENAIRAIKLRFLTPKDSNIGVLLNKLKQINPYMYEDLLNKYKRVLEDLNKK